MLKLYFIQYDEFVNDMGDKNHAYKFIKAHNAVEAVKSIAKNNIIVNYIYREPTDDSTK